MGTCIIIITVRRAREAKAPGKKGSKTMMNAMELDFYEAGIKDANEARRIVFAGYSKRYESLSRKHSLTIGKQSLRCLDAYSKGVAYEINRQTRLEM